MQTVEHEGERAAGPRPLPPEEFMGEVRLQLAESAESRPYVVVIGALVAGYVLGAGLPRWALRAASAAGSRVVAARLAAAVLGEAAAGLSSP
jgi:hypothetical protein